MTTSKMNDEAVASVAEDNRQYTVMDKAYPQSNLCSFLYTPLNDS